MIRGRGGIQAAVAFALLAAAGAARAAPDLPDLPDLAPRVALLSTIANEPLAGRIDAELHTVGIEVSRAAITSAMEIEAQVRAALGAGARAVVVADVHRTDVWIAQVGSDRIGFRQELEVDETSGMQAVLALRTVEFLRISLGLVSGPTVVSLEAPPIARAAMPVAPAPERWMAVEVSTGVLASAGGLEPVPVAGLSVRAQLAGLIGAELLGYAPLSESQLPTPDAQAPTSIWLAGGGLVLVPGVDRRVSFDAALGALAIFVRSTGTSSAQRIGTTEEETGLALYARGATRFRLAQRLALRIDLLGGAAIRRPVIAVTNGPDLAAFGTAFVAGLGGAELRF